MSRLMDPDRFQMKDLKRNVATAERHIERLKGKLRALEDRVKAIEEWRHDIHQSWPPPPPPKRPSSVKDII